MIYNQFQKKCIKEVALSARRIIDELIDSIQPDITTTYDLDIMSKRLIGISGAKAVLFGSYIPINKTNSLYTHHIFISINDEIVYGAPSPSRVIHKDDLVKINLCISRDRYYADLAKTIWVGNDSEHKLVSVAKEAINNVIDVCKSGCSVYDLSIAIETTALKHDCYTIDVISGHGIGKNPHEDPMIPNSSNVKYEYNLVAGNIITIEPVICSEKTEIEVSDNKYTILSKNHCLSAHIGNMLYVTDGGCEILA